MVGARLFLGDLPRRPRSLSFGARRFVDATSISRRIAPRPLEADRPAPSTPRKETECYTVGLLRRSWLLSAASFPLPLSPQRFARDDDATAHPPCTWLKTLRRLRRAPLLLSWPKWRPPPLQAFAVTSRDRVRPAHPSLAAAGVPEQVIVNLVRLSRPDALPRRWCEACPARSSSRLSTSAC